MAGFKCPHCGGIIDIFAGNGVKKAAEDFNVEILASIPIDPNIVNTGDEGRPYIYDYGKLDAAKVMQEITKKIIASIE
jgi:CO dehydrogenase nickel-insertion accessory protein CooC1